MKKIVFLCISLAISSISLAQTIKFSGILKGTASRLHFSDINDPTSSNSGYTTTYYQLRAADFNSRMRPGFEAGVGLETKPEKRLHFRTGLMLQQQRFTLEIIEENSSPTSPYPTTPGRPMGGHWAGTDYTFVQPVNYEKNRNALLYASVPLLAEYRVFNNLNFLAGAQVAALVSATHKAEVTYATYTSAEPNTPTYHTETVSTNMKEHYAPIQVAALLGANYPINSLFTVEVNYSRSLHELNKTSSSNYRTRMSTVSMGLLVNFLT